jgi:RTX calcium-binding nonapeptide repeat (4 copies)
MSRTLRSAAVARAAVVAVPSVAHGATLHQDGRTPRDDRIRRDVETVLGSQFADALAGSPGTVRLAGNDGDDQITGGSGQELLSGGDGQDRIDARDGTPDSVDCGGQLLDWAAVDLTGEASITGCAQVTS